jgi:hypothetical protein
VSFDLLKEVIESSDKLKTPGNDFKACGFYPQNLNALDYSKYLRTSSASRLTENSRNTEHELDTTIRLSHLLKSHWDKNKLRNSKEQRIFFMVKIRISSHCFICGSTFRKAGNMMNFQILQMVKYKTKINL